MIDLGAERHAVGREACDGGTADAFEIRLIVYRTYTEALGPLSGNQRVGLTCWVTS